MPDIDKRLRYYNGQRLDEQDFTAEQEYHLDRQRRHNRQFHTYGIAEGLSVTAAIGAVSAIVSPGTAIDREGRAIVLTESRTVTFNSFTGSVLVVISYSEQESDPDIEENEGNTRWREQPDVRVIAEAAAQAADVQIRLARLQVAANGTVSQHDTTVRPSATAKLTTGIVDNAALANLAVDNAKLADNTINEIKLDAATRDKLTDALPRTGGGTINGNLIVAGNLNVIGLINGFDSVRHYSFGIALSDNKLDTVTRVATPGFRARAITVSGAAHGTFNTTGDGDFSYGAAISGIALIGPTGIVEYQVGNGPDITRLQTGNFMLLTNTQTDMIAYGRFTLKFGVNPYRDIEYSVSVGSVTPTQLTFTVKRSTTETYTLLGSQFFMNAIIFG